jgi:DNA-binding NtrC family response regulator
MSDRHMPLVLVIDPDPRTAASLVPLLAAGGYRAASCSSVAKALSVVRRDHPDLVIVGKERENCDGMILIGRIKELCPDTRAILLVEADDWPSPLDATDTGADDLQRKHFGAAKLFISVSLLLDPACDQETGKDSRKPSAFSLERAGR